MRAGSIFILAQILSASWTPAHTQTKGPAAIQPRAAVGNQILQKRREKRNNPPLCQASEPPAAWGAHLHRHLLCLIFSFCAEHPGLVHGEMLLCSGPFCLACCTSSANPLGAFETSTFAQPPRYTFLLYGKLIAHYHVARVAAPDAYRRPSQAAKVNDRLIGAKEPI